MPRVKWSADMGPEWDIPRFRRRCRQLRKYFPVSKRVIIRLLGEVRNDQDIVHGHCWETEKCFVIEVQKVSDISHSISTLAHEYCHARIPARKSDGEIHPPAFWLELGRIMDFILYDVRPIAKD